MKCINHGPAFTYASLTNSPDVRSAPAAALPNHSPSSLPVSPIRDETIGPGDTRASAGAAQVPLPTLNSHDCLGTDRRRRQRATRLTRQTIYLIIYSPFRSFRSTQSAACRPHTSIQPMLKNNTFVLGSFTSAISLLPVSRRGLIVSCRRCISTSQVTMAPPKPAQDFLDFVNASPTRKSWP